jgi:DNA-binding CsgD family transcriptional regulator
MDLIFLDDLPESEDTYVKFLGKICAKFGFDDAAYAGINPAAGTMHTFVTYSEDWKEHYKRNSFQLIDPTLHTALRSVAPVDWSRLRRDANYARVFRDAGDFGIGQSGMTIPVRGPFGEFGMLSVTRQCSEKEWQTLRGKTLSELQSIAAHLHDHVMRTDTLTRSLHRPRLSKREVEVLQWVAAGKSQQDVGDILSISNRTVEVHLRSIRHKLLALTTAQAVGRAVGLGLIFPS